MRFHFLGEVALAAASGQAAAQSDSSRVEVRASCLGSLQRDEAGDDLRRLLPLVTSDASCFWPALVIL